MKPVILAEKKKQAEEAYGEALKPYSKKEGYLEVYPNDVFPQGAYITWASGHLLELAEPSYYKEEWAKWDINHMPIKPESFTFLVTKSKQKQYSIVERLLKYTSDIVIATDADREGENIAWSILYQAGVQNKSLKRLWINSLETDVVREGFKNLKDGKAYFNSYKEAQTRQISDWLIGMNASRLYTLLLNKQGAKDSFSVGRVQTPTLYLIYQREKEIENFKPKAYFENMAQVKHSGGIFEVKAEGKFGTKEEATNLFEDNGLSDGGPINTQIENVKESKEKELSPRLFNLSTLQTKANKKWKYSPTKALELAQSLYEKKLLTYPRSGSQHITDSEFNYLVNNVKKLQKVFGAEFPIYNEVPQKRYVDGEKVQEHYAIIPTKKVPNVAEIEKLSQEEYNIYHLVVMNTLSMFHEPYQYNKTVITLRIDDLEFSATGKVETRRGWKELLESKENKGENKIAPQDQELPSVKVGDSVLLTPKVKEGKTSKPKRYTYGELIPLMKSAGKYLEDDEKEVLKESEGIGTEATRATMTEMLQYKKYIKVEKNKVYVTSKGVILCEAVEGTLLSSASMTAKWEEFLKKIGSGSKKQDAFLSNVGVFIDKMMEEIPEKIKSSNVTATIEDSQRVESLGDCPICSNGRIEDKGKFFGCSEYKNGCKQTFSKKFLEKTISKAQLKKLLTKGKTDKIKGFKGKKVFDAVIVLADDSGREIKRYSFDFN